MAWAAQADSVQGSHYTRERFQWLSTIHGIERSMRRSDECLDSAVTESVLSRTKDERVSCSRSQDEPRGYIFDYTVWFQNPRRRHTSLGGISLMKYGRWAGLAWVSEHRTWDMSLSPAPLQLTVLTATFEKLLSTPLLLIAVDTKKYVSGERLSTT
jgi:hypothetical protein